MADIIGSSNLKATSEVEDDLAAAMKVKLSDDLMVPEDISDTMGYLDKAESALSALELSNQDLLSGKLSDDVKKQITQQSAESAALKGLGIGKSAGALTLRDLGLTSLQAVQAGQKTQATVVSGYQTLGNAREAIREYNSSYKQNAQNLVAQQQQLQLANVQTALAYDEFKVQTNMDVNAQIVNLSTLRENLLYNYSVNDIKDQFADTSTSLQNLIDQLGQLGGV